MFICLSKNSSRITALNSIGNAQNQDPSQYRITVLNFNQDYFFGQSNELVFKVDVDQVTGLTENFMISQTGGNYAVENMEKKLRQHDQIPNVTDVCNGEYPITSLI